MRHIRGRKIVPGPGSNSHDVQGFTLTEVMIAIVVFSVGLLGAAQVNIGVIHSNRFSKQLAVATTLAQDQIERIKRLGYASASTAAGTEAYGSIANHTAFRRVTTVSANTPATGMHTATVTVFWDSNARSVTLSTILGE
jgi:type IV pilus assembly protein PilV